MRVMTLDQGSPDWLTWRKRGLGASDSTVILGLSPWRSRTQLLHEKIEDIRNESIPPSRRPTSTRKQPDNFAMARGRMMEPIARNLYTSLTGIQAEPLCCIHESMEWLRASLDGWNEEMRLALEIKCVNQKDHETALFGQVPEKYIPQVQHQLIVTGSPLAHYFSYTDNKRFRGTDKGALVLVPRDEAYQSMLVEKLVAFWEEVKDAVRQPAWLAG